jgi:Ion transport protein
VASSLIDMSVTTVDLPFIKVLRLLRVLRPLRFISHNESIKLLINALMQSRDSMINVIIVVLMFWIIFSILAINFLQDKVAMC